MVIEYVITNLISFTFYLMQHNHVCTTYISSISVFGSRMKLWVNECPCDFFDMLLVLMPF